MRYYCPNLLFFKQRTTENSLKSILFFAEGFKDKMINFKCIHEGINGVYLLTKFGPNLTVSKFKGKFNQ